MFWENGYASTSLSELMHATGLSKSSLHNTYGSKRGMFDRAFANYLDEIITPLFEPMEAPGSGKKETHRLLLGLSTDLPGPLPDRGHPRMPHHQHRRRAQRS